MVADTVDPGGTIVHDTAVKLLSRAHTVVFRMTKGRIGRRLVDNDMLLLTTKGEHTARDHTVPLLYLRGDDRFVVIASYGGRSEHPQWYRNLVANPDVTVQVNGVTAHMLAATMSADEREEWWPRAVEAWSDYATYQSRTNREIPIVWLIPSDV